MVEKVKRNDHGDCIYDEDTLLEYIYQNPEIDISKFYIDQPETYLSALNELGIELPTVQRQPKHNEKPAEMDQRLQSSWYMPKEYNDVNVLEYLLAKCQTIEEEQRVRDEYALFDQKGFTKVLQFLIYFIDTLRNNNVVWGVGRGSSVSSFCLFLIGVHKINPLLYNLDYREFLR